MSLHEPTRWLVSYDIGDARRGARVLRLMKKHGVPLQYSVFIVHATGAQVHALMRQVERLIRPDADDVRAYRVPIATECHQLGDGKLPEGVLLGADLPVALPANKPTHRRVPSECASDR